MYETNRESIYPRAGNLQNMYSLRIIINCYFTEEEKKKQPRLNPGRVGLPVKERMWMRLRILMR